MATRSWFLSGRPTPEELLEIQTHFGLPNAALVEKDWHVLKALTAITARDLSPFRLVFGGGTALSRAHGLIRRMSEDIDLKIISDGKPSRRQLGDLRDRITDALLAAGFVFDPQNPEHRQSMYKNRFVRYRLFFVPIIKGEGALRPEIQVDTLAIQARRPTVERPVRSFVAEGYDRPAEVASIACSAIPESAAEKLVALTRRAGAELAGLREKHDPTLVRHVYDLHGIRDEYDAADVANLAREIMIDDARTYGRDFPAYQADPLAETLKAIDGIATDRAFAEDYASFCRGMVYGEVPEFATAMGTLKNLAQRLK
jgi:predicted nucleotidyltransferase component of viral defense system